MHRRPSQPGGARNRWGWLGRLGQCRAGDARRTHTKQEGRVQHVGFGHGGRRPGSPQGQREALGVPWVALLLMPRNGWLCDARMPIWPRRSEMLFCCRFAAWGRRCPRADAGNSTPGELGVLGVGASPAWGVCVMHPAATLAWLSRSPAPGAWERCSSQSRQHSVYE